MSITISGTTGIDWDIDIGNGGGGVTTNTAVGAGTLVLNTTGALNTAVGYQAGYNNTGGARNTFFGYQSGYTSNGSGDTGNTSVGAYSGYSLTTGTNNTFIGAGGGSGYYVTSGSKNTILGSYSGNGSGLDIRTSSNYIVLSDGDGNPRIVGDSSGNVGIGTVTPAHKLNVYGLGMKINNGSYTGYFGVGSTFITGGGATDFAIRSDNALVFGAGGSLERMRIDSSGNLGLGVTPSAWYSGWTPAFQMKSYAVTADVNTHYVSNNAVFGVDTTWRYMASKYALHSEVDAALGQFRWYTAPSGTAGNAISFTQAMTLDASGNLGIGTSSPSRLLDVRGPSSPTVKIRNTALGAGNITQLLFEGTNDFSGDSTSFIQSIAISAGNSNTALVFGTNAAGGGAAAERVRIDSSGNVGIGTSSPTKKLEVANSDALIYGITVGRGAGAVSTNTAVGASALGANTSGSYNTASGVTALFSNTTGSYNTASGRGALFSNTTGVSNTASGMNALFYNTTGNDNTASGLQALYYNTIGINNTASGLQALFYNTTGSSNTASGVNAGYSNTTGTSLVVMGKTALYNNTTGAYNTAVGAPDAGGQSTMGTNSTGSYNTALGSGALSLNTTASYNTAVGYNALYSNTTGTENTAIGRVAGYLNSTGSYNAFLGHDSGYNTTSSYNTFVGHLAGFSVTSGAKNTILGRYNGNQGGLDIRTASNYIVLSDGDGNPRIVSNGSGNVGIGREPMARLDVNLTSPGTLGTVVNVNSFGTAATLTLGGVTNNTDGVYLGTGTSAGTSVASGIGFLRESIGWNSALAFYTNSVTAGPNGVSAITERARIDSSGNLLVGTTSNYSGSKLAVSAGIVVGNSLGRHPNGTSYGGIAWAYNSNNSGTLLLGSTDVSADQIRFFVAAGQVGSITSTSLVTSYNTMSDHRLKNNQATLTGSGTFIDALKPKTWQWAADGSAGVGFIAHEFQEVSPSSVSGTKDAMRDEEYEVSPAVPAVLDEEGAVVSEAVEAVKGTRSVPQYQGMQASSSEVMANIIAELQSLRTRAETAEARLEKLEGAT